jgi:hypothetical protein
MHRTVQLIGDQLVLFTVTARDQYEPADIVHWFLGDGRKPPLDIAVDAPSGRLVEVTFFASHETIPHNDRGPVLPAEREGQPIFDTSLWAQWQSGDRYFDTTGEARLHLHASDLVVTFEASAIASVVGSSDLAFLINQGKYASGLVLPRLGDDALAVLRAAHVLAEAS